MSAADLEERMANLEKVVEPLRTLPDRVSAVELQIVQLRGEMADGFSAVRGEMARMKTELRGEMAEMKSELRGDIGALRTEVREDIAALGREMASGFLAADARSQQMHDRTLVLLEEALGKRKRLDEGNPGG